MDIPQEAFSAVDAAAANLMAIPGVIGVGIGLREDSGELSEELAVRVLVTDASNIPDGIPESLAGLGTCIVEFPVEALFDPDTKRYDDLQGGAQIQPAPSASGTLGAIVHDSNGVEVGLTCHHVVGDPGSLVWQAVAPMIIAGVDTPVDLTDGIGKTLAAESPKTQTIPVPSGSELLLGKPLDAATVSLDEARNHNRTISHGIVDGFGVVDSSTSPSLKMPVKKRGSQSGPTTGLVVGVHPFVEWNGVAAPSPGHSFVMSHTYEIFFNPVGCPDGIFAKGGDSGSLVLEEGTQTAVGLLWGGVPSGGMRGFMCDITVVESRLGISVVWPAQ
ncbi:hypothetical protein ACFY1P_03565 [Streptomyces sp. NPDC001407]|uniref:hypothetical protein n=1 Tax=Streptomyces sp. NPDC001407 TaxID=3364573 RepID=UPI0036B42B9C